jgi:hypothetical protein
MTADRSLILRLTESLAADEERTFPTILKSWDQEPDELPYLVASSEFTGSSHRRLQNLELRLAIHSNRCDTTEAERADFQSALLSHLEANARTIAETMMGDGWQVRVWDLLDPIDEEGEKNEWVSGYDYRLVLMKI